MGDTDCIITETVLAALQNHHRSLSGVALKVMVGGTERQIRAAISTLRRGGWLVVGDWSGYRFAQNVKEVEEIANRLEEQAKMLQETAQIMRVSAASAMLL